MGYAEAIERQMGVLRYWQHPHSYDQAVWWFAGWEGRQEMADADRAGRDWQPPEKVRSEAQFFRLAMLTWAAQATPFFVGADICNLIESSARSLPASAPLRREAVPGECGFVWFEKPLTIVSGTPGDDPMCALLWWISRGDPGLMMVGFYKKDLRDFPGVAQPQLIHPWMFGEGRDDGIGMPLMGMDTQSRDYPQLATVRSQYLALLEFLAQRILTTSARPLLNRGARKRAARTLEHVPEVRVVELRARDYRQRDESDARDVEYTCQWLVRGHWHQYHTKEGLQPRWVMPYVKGPSDKPLRVAEKVAYEVVR